jgi:hypothetical protein
MSYPPYTSKYNPIEHRLFPHVTRACQGVVFRSVALVKQLMEKARTLTGLSVVVDILDRVYAKGRKVAKEVRQAVNIVRDEILPLWNYRILPAPRKKYRLKFGTEVIVSAILTRGVGASPLGVGVVRAASGEIRTLVD